MCNIIVITNKLSVAYLEETTAFNLIVFLLNIKKYTIRKTIEHSNRPTLFKPELKNIAFDTANLKWAKTSADY